MRNVVLYGDCLAQLEQVPSGTVQTCVTSPPFFGLRDYGTRRWFDGDSNCEHDTKLEYGPHHPGQVEQTKWQQAKAAGEGQTATTSGCSKCGAWYGQLGLEPTVKTYVEHMVQVFRLVRRALRSDGSLWLNIGDSFAFAREGEVKPKDLLGVPWALATALRKDGWFLRSDIIWHKPNVFPESVEDRPTNAYEHVFLLTKESNYFYDANAIREPSADGCGERNKRNVWSINTKPYKGAHFAVMAPELAQTCIKAGSREGDLVLDPFAGSGTTLMAAKNLRRDFLGVEINESYRTLIEARVRRAEAWAAERDLFDQMMDES